MGANKLPHFNLDHDVLALDSSFLCLTSRSMASASVSKSEQAYIRASLHADPPVRADGRALTDYRAIFLETGVAPLANGSARVSLGHSTQEGGGGGGTEVLAAVRTGRRLIKLAPLRETGYQILMSALAAEGNTAEALSVYAGLSDLLRDELGAFPASILWDFRVSSLLTLVAMWALIGAVLTALVDRTWRRQEAVEAQRAWAAAL